SVFVVFGNPGLDRVDLASLGAGGFRIDGAHAGDALGSSIAAVGDVDGDGRADLATGAPGADLGLRLGAGAVYVVSGQTSSAPLDLLAPGARASRIDGAANGDRAGAAIAPAGTFLAAGGKALAVGAPGGGTAARTHPGAVFVVPLGTGGGIDLAD